MKGKVYSLIKTKSGWLRRFSFLSFIDIRVPVRCFETVGKFYTF